MPLVIVESPTKSRTLQGFLGSGYRVLSSYGHIRDLPASELGVDIEHDFEPKYVIPPKSRKTITLLKKATKEAEAVILASVDYKEPVLIKCPDGALRQYKIGAFIDKIFKEKIDFSSFKIPAFDFRTQKTSFKPIKGISRHPVKEQLLEVNLDYGRKIRITASHSVFTKDKKGKIKLVSGKDLKIGDKLLVPLRIPLGSPKFKKIDLLKAIYEDKSFREQVFIRGPKVHQYQKEKVLAPKVGNIPQFQPRLILSSKLRGVLKRKREELGWSQRFLANRMNCSQAHISELEKKENPTLALGKKYLENLGLNLEKLIKNPGATIAPSSIEIAIKNALETQWNDSRKSLTHTWQPLTRFSWKEIEKNFKNDKKLKISRHNHLHLMPRFVAVNKSLMLFLGFFVAEGSYLQNAVKFSFGHKTLGGKEENIERVKNISKQLFGLSPSDFEDRSSNSVVLSSSLVSFLMKNVLATRSGAGTKEVPWIAFNVPGSLQLAFLEGLFLGDGSLGKSNIAFNTISQELAYGIRHLLLQNGILSSHSVTFSKKPNRKPFHHITISGKEQLKKIKPIWEKHYKAGLLKNYLQWKGPKSDNKKNWSLVQNQKGDLGLLKIQSIKRIKPSKPFVYDFSVEGENFICGDGGVCAHNTDEDREGEAIAWHLTQILNLNGKKEYQRIVFHEITKTAIEEALKNPRKIDAALVDAQQARRILDRIVGYKLSPFLWKKVARGLSAGRVQSVAVRLVVEREKEIETFTPQEYWTIEALLKKDKELKALLIKKNNKTLDKLAIKNKKEADKIKRGLKGAEYKVEKVEKKEVKRNPFPPFTTSTLQQEAWRRFRFPARQTMQIAQQLYERGYTTYHRTDSLNLSNLALGTAKNFISKNYGQNYYQFRRYKAKGRAQEAHEAIRPTYPDRTPEKVKLETQQKKLYDLVWKRFIASQMASALFDATTVDIKAKNYTFRATGQTLKFDGFLKVYPMKFAGLRPSHASAKASAYEEAEIPLLKKNDILELIKLLTSQHFTQPPPRYTEATLIKALEENGIGRPSTYAPILSTVQERNYITKDEQRRFQPTEMGNVVNDLLVNHFPKIVDIKFTARMEEDLDEIAEKKKQWVPVVRDFYTPFEENLEKKYEEVSKKDITEKPTEKTCPKCKSPLVIRMGKFGQFYACSQFPKCRYTEPLEKNVLGIKCPKCQKGEIVEKRTRTNKIFYGCDQFPKCDFALWEKPIKEKCPECGSLLVEKGKQIKCSNTECPTRTR